MPNKEIIALEKELKGLKLEHAGSELVSVLNKLAFAGIHSDPRKAKTCVLEAQDLAGKLELPVEQAKSYKTLGIINCEGGNFAEAMSHCRKSMEIYEKLGDKKGMAQIHGTMATTYKFQGMIDKALEHYQESLRRKQEYGASKDELALCYFNIGSCFSGLHRLEQAQSFYEYARKIWEESGNRHKLAYLLPICANCKKVRDDDGYWQQIESYISEHSDAKISHGICPECMIKLYGKDCTREQ